MFLTGTLLNVAAVLVGTRDRPAALGARMPARIQTSLTTALGLFVALLGIGLGLRIFTDPAGAAGRRPRRARRRCCSAWWSASCCASTTGWRRSVAGSSAAWRAARARPSRIAEGFVTASLVFCVGPLTILGSLENGLTGDIQLLAIKSLLDGVASIAFAAALGPGVALAALTVLVVQGGDRRRARSCCAT